MKIYIVLMGLFLVTIAFSQEKTPEKLPYHKIPEYPETYAAGTVVARMIDGLGFRYYWATEGLRDQDLAYKPSETNRTIEETINHLYGLSHVIYNSAKKEINDRSQQPDEELTFQEKRAHTLFNFKIASDIFLTVDDLTEYMVIFESKTGQVEYPFWNQINGPIEDAVWHCGQVVVLRRASGNPIDPEVSFFRGAKRNK